jgi:hypothetical protein
VNGEQEFDGPEDDGRGPDEPPQSPMPAAVDVEWARDSSNIADLLEWLDEADEIDRSDWENLMYMLRRPEKWAHEYQKMRDGQHAAEVQARDEKRGRR